MSSTPIWIYNRHEVLQMVLKPDGAIPHFDSWFREALNGAVELTFSVPASDPSVSEISNDGRAVIRDNDGDFVEFIIREPEDTNGPDGPIKNVFAEGGDYELIDEWMPGFKGDNVTLSYALPSILTGTRWTMGRVDNFGTESIDIEPTTVKHAIMQLVQIFGGQIKYRVEHDGNQITKRYIDILKKRGENRGKRFEYGRDIQSISYSPDSTGIKTRLYGYGASGDNDGPRLTFAGVSWSKADGDPVDKPLGQTWVGDEEAKQRWGYAGGSRHRSGKYSGQEEDAGVLLLNTWNELQKMNGLTETYDLKVDILEERPGRSSPVIVRLGDSVLGIDRDIQPNIEIFNDIIEYRQNLNDSSLDEVTIGQFRNVLDIAGRQRDIGNVVEDKQGNWDKKETPDGADEKAKVEAQKAIDEAQIRIDAAQAEIDIALGELEDAMNNIEIGKEDIIGLDFELNELHNALDNKIPIGMAAADVNSGNTAILGKNLVIDGNATVTGRIGASGATFLNLGTEYMVAKDVTIERATITGIIDAPYARILRASLENVTITGSLNSVGGTFTGQLDGVNGTFTGDLVGGRIMSNTTIDVTTDLRVGNNIYVGPQHMAEGKGVYFTPGNAVRNGSFGIEMVSSDEVTIWANTRISFGTSSSGGTVHSDRTVTLGNVVSSRRARIFHDPSGTTGSSGTRDRLKLEAGDGRAGIWVTPLTGSVYLRWDGTNTHSFLGDGRKIGGTIDVEGHRYGMSPIDSPLTLISDVISDIVLNGRSTIYLDDLFTKTIESYTIFPNNNTVKIIEKHDDRFVVEGEGLTDFHIMGIRVGSEGTYFTDVTKMSDDMNDDIEENSEEVVNLET